MSRNFFGRPFLVDFALVHEHDPVGHVAGEGHFMGDQHDGKSFFCQLGDDFENFTDEFGIEG